jgi:hypothetical protein
VTITQPCDRVGVRLPREADRAAMSPQVDDHKWLVEAASAASIAGGDAFPWIKDTTGNQSYTSLQDVVVKIFPSCGEATAAFVPMKMHSKVPDLLALPSKWSELAQESRDDSNSRRGTTRSRVKMRQYMVHNRLVKMWVLTFVGEGLHGITGYLQAQLEVAAFMKRLRRDFFRGKPFPYLWAIEPHPQGHGWHVNLMLQNVFIKKSEFQRCWQSSESRINGNVWFTDFTVDREDWLGRSIGGKRGKTAPAGSRTAAKLAASYASKYIGKDLHDGSDIPAGAHRYEVAQGFQPVPVIARFETFEQAAWFVLGHPSMGSLEWFSRSCDWDDWDGPPVQLFRFDPPTRRSRH